MSAVAEQTQLLADRINALEESSTLAMTKKARELAAEGHKVISLSVGEPDFKTPAHICEAAKKAIDDGFHGYSPVAGYPDLRKAIADKLKRDNNIDWKPENIVVSTGAKHSLANAIQVLVNPGDEVLILAPYWVSYSEMVKLAEGKSVIVDGSLRERFQGNARATGSGHHAPHENSDVRLAQQSYGFGLFRSRTPGPCRCNRKARKRVCGGRRNL